MRFVRPNGNRFLRRPTSAHTQEPPADKMANGAYSNLVNRVDVVTKTASMHWIEVANLRELLLA